MRIYGTECLKMVNKKRLISLDEALKATHGEIYWTESQQASVRSFLVQQPKVDAVEVVHGRWIKQPVNSSWWVVCSECGITPTNTRDMTHYCPNCGAKMDGDGDGAL